ncbi:MAG: aromatic ring-hydroxylating dioxygenase subunit alpha [Pseudomonadota bacterium]
MSSVDGLESGATLEHALAASYYTEPRVFHREREAIFFRTWQFACHRSQVSRPGDYVVFSVLDQSLFVICGADGQARAFYNVCKHRAHELLSGAGRKSVVTCPYHAWTYETDGRLRRAPNSENVPGFDRTKICLTEARLEDFCGFLFVNLDPEARPMDELYPGVRDELRTFLPGIDDLAPVDRLSVEEACNWKVAVENYNECYHCRVAHPTFAKGVVLPDSYNVLPQGYCLRHTACAAPSQAMTYEIDPTSHADAGNYSSWFLWPTFSFQVYPGGVLNTYFWHPLKTAETRAFREWFAPGGQGSETLAKLARQDQETTVAEDIVLVNSVQRGLSNRGYQPGPLILDPRTGINSEHSVAAFKGWVLEALEDDTL